jgi:hypothetical protein
VHGLLFAHMYHSQSELPPEDIQIIKYSNGERTWVGCL